MSAPILKNQKHMVLQKIENRNTTQSSNSISGSLKILIIVFLRFVENNYFLVL